MFFFGNCLKLITCDSLSIIFASDHSQAHQADVHIVPCLLKFFVLYLCSIFYTVINQCPLFTIKLTDIDLFHVNNPDRLPTLILSTTLRH